MSMSMAMTSSLMLPMTTAQASARPRAAETAARRLRRPSCRSFSFLVMMEKKRKENEAHSLSFRLFLKRESFFSFFDAFLSSSVLWGKKIKNGEKRLGAVTTAPLFFRSVRCVVECLSSFLDPSFLFVSFLLYIYLLCSLPLFPPVQHVSSCRLRMGSYIEFSSPRCCSRALVVVVAGVMNFLFQSISHWKLFPALLSPLSSLTFQSKKQCDLLTCSASSFPWEIRGSKRSFPCGKLFFVLFCFLVGARPEGKKTL